MPSWGSRATPSVGLQEGRLGRREKLAIRAGGSDVPVRRGKLQSWASIQRKTYMAGSLAQDHIDQLNSIGFKWALLIEQRAKLPWETRFKELVQYKTENGDCDNPARQGKLGTWVRMQRRNYLAGSLAQDHINRLSGIGFKWALVVKGPQVPWEIQFNELVQYKAKHGDCDVPKKQGKLGNWMNNQRFNCKEGKLSQDRIDRLSSIGFKWALVERAPSVPWETRFKELIRYKTEHGDCNVPQSHGQLGRWVFTQRKDYRKWKLSQDHIERLDGIGFDWTPPRGSRKRKSTPSSRKQSLSRKERVSSPSTNVNSLSAIDGTRGVAPNGSREKGVTQHLRCH